MNKLLLSIGFTAMLTLALAGVLGAQPIQITDVDPGTGINETNFIPRVILPGNKLLFPITVATGYGYRKVHAYTAGINGVVNLAPNYYSYIEHNSLTNGKAVFQGGMSLPSSGARVWVSDGTQPGTNQLLTLNPSCGTFESVKATDVNGIGYLALGAAKCTKSGSSGTASWLYKTNGTPTGTSTLKSWTTNGFTSGTGQYLPLNGLCIFTQYNGSSYGIWKTNGTSKGTTQLKAFTGFFGGAVICGNRYVCPATDANGKELWQTDGTTSGTIRVADIFPGASSSQPSYLTVLGSDVYFAATTANGKGLYKYTPPSGPLVQIPMDATTPMWLTVMDGQLYFSAHTANDGRELWVYNPSSNTAPNPRMVGTGIGAGILSGDPRYGEPQSPTMQDYDQFFAQLNGYLYFAANDGSGYKLWRSNGSTLSEVVDANTGLARHNSLTVMGGKLYFIAHNTTEGYCLYEYTPIPKQSARSVSPDAITLDQNYPNPFNPSTEISFRLPNAANVTLLVTDALGREVARLCDAEYRQAGTHSVSFDARDLPSGLFLYRLETAGLVLTRKMVLMR